ncbi:MAG: S-layer homology domain-containing protein [Clostridia bacterium]|nr:S-layer homology domain-containing protein [Clostridia bacterium]MBQ9997983.1 S-layer homology domain-containing protein [Clostridia bacterium]
MMKRILALMLAIAVSVIGLSFCVSAAAVVTITTGMIDATGVAANGEISVPLTISNIVDSAIKGVQIDFTFDKTKFEFVKVKREMKVYNTNSSGLENATWNSNVTAINQNGGGSVVFYDASSGTRSFTQQSLNANNKLVTLVFKRKAGVTSNTSVTFNEIILNGLSNTEYKISKGHIDCDDAQIKLVKSNDATLSSLTASPAVLSPAFNSGVYSYTATVPYDTPSVTVAATASDSSATVSSGTGVKTLATGDNTITVKCIAEDGVTYKNYTIVITKETPPAYLSDNTLSALSIEGLTLSPAFSSGTVTYTAATDTQTVPAITATPTVDGAAVNIVKPAQFAVGANTITITVTAIDGTTKTYTVNVTYTPPAYLSDCTLSALSIEGLTLSPAFSSGTVTYTAATESETVPAVTATPTVDGATFSVVKPAQFVEGENTITITVTAINGTTKTYTVNVTYTPPAYLSDNTLSALSIAGLTLSPSFSGDITSYAATTESQTVPVITATPNVEGATVDIVKPATFSQGRNEILITVTAINGTEKRYIVAVTYTNDVTELSDDNTLKELVVKQKVNNKDKEIELSPDFSASTTKYTGKTGNNNKLEITATPNDDGATVSIPTQSKLDKGENTINIVVTAANGETKTYKLVITYKTSDGGGGGGGGGGGAPTTPVEPSTPTEPNTPTTPSRPSDKFKDLSGYDWALESIDKLVTKGIVSGTSGTTFEPGKSVTRAEFAKLVVASFGLTLNSDKVTTFSDVNPSEWYKQYVDIAVSNGIVTGYENNTFRPNNTISREEMCVMLARALKAYELEDKESKTFADAHKVSDWAKDAVALLSSQGIINGKGNDMFAPLDNASRAESAVTISRILTLIGK